MGQPFQLGRYTLHAELAAGGMATVYLARQSGAVGFGKTVAIKRLHPHLARDQYFVTMFLDEARLAARINHPNVVPILDVVSTENELFLVLEFVRGETLAGLMRAARKQNVKVPVPVAAAIVIGMLAGLHAAHEATDEAGKRLNIVHRDVSPQNVIVGADGVPRVLDFGVAKAATRLQTTREGQLKGKIPYMAPEQLSGDVTPRTDVYAAAIVLWETLTLERLFKGDSEAQMLHLVMTKDALPPSTLNPEVPAGLDAVILKGLRRDPAERYASAREMAAAIEAAAPPASPMKVAEWVEGIIGPTLAKRDVMRAEIESTSSGAMPAVPPSLSSTPALPAFPQISDVSSPSMSMPQPVGVAESTASLVLGGGAAPAQARSRWPLVAAGIGVVGILGAAVMLGMVFARPPPKVEAPRVEVATTPPPPPVTPPIVDAGSVIPATVTPPPAVTRKPNKPLPATTTKPKSDDISSLLDTR
jgi:serine/threonine-protein kinase